MEKLMLEFKSIWGWGFQFEFVSLREVCINIVVQDGAWCFIDRRFSRNILPWVENASTTWAFFYACLEHIFSSIFEHNPFKNCLGIIVIFSARNMLIASRNVCCFCACFFSQRMLETLLVICASRNAYYQYIHIKIR